MLLEALDIHLAAFQIAGGIVLFLFALTMIFGESKVDEERRQINPNAGDLARFSSSKSATTFRYSPRRAWLEAVPPAPVT